MKRTNLLIIATLGIAASILWIPVSQMTRTFAADDIPPVPNSDAVNEVGIHTVFHFRDAVETVDSFKVFDTLSSGFDRTKAVNFRLEGIVGPDKPILYKAIDTTFYQGKNVQHEFAEFDVDVSLYHGDEVYRVLTYLDCQIKNYNVLTLYDADETYSGKTKFTYVDRIEFECRGFELTNPPYEKMIQDEKQRKTEEALKPITEKMLDKK